MQKIPEFDVVVALFASVVVVSFVVVASVTFGSNVLTETDVTTQTKRKRK